MKSSKKIVETQEKICMFTGHRILGGDFCSEALYEQIRKALERGVYTYLCGMAIGFDLLAAELLLSMKEKYPQIRLIACIPCPNQQKYYSEDDKMRYYLIRQVVDEEIVLFDHYFRGCMLARDRYMAERANMMITYCTKKEGGTAYTVRCFEELHPDGEKIFL